uniref:Uncharacterized protein n=1 Tax=Rhizophora mucronata TaxID=61149 RepID=A0A2P2PTW9_RHIMU
MPKLKKVLTAIIMPDYTAANTSQNLLQLCLLPLILRFHVLSFTASISQITVIVSNRSSSSTAAITAMDM